MGAPWNVSLPTRCAGFGACGGPAASTATATRHFPSHAREKFCFQGGGMKRGRSSSIDNDACEASGPQLQRSRHDDAGPPELLRSLAHAAEDNRPGASRASRGQSFSLGFYCVLRRVGLINIQLASLLSSASIMFSCDIRYVFFFEKMSNGFDVDLLSAVCARHENRPVGPQNSEPTHQHRAVVNCLVAQRWYRP